MLKDITLGQYFPGNSIVHKLDPRVKIILIAVLIVMLFVTNTLIAYLLLAGFILLTVYLSKLSFRMILRGLKPVLVIILITGILNLFYTPGVEVLRLFQSCDPWLHRQSPAATPLVTACRQVWQDHGNGNPEHLSTLAAQLMAFWNKK